MRKILRGIIYLLATVSLFACSIEVSQQPATATVPPTTTAPPANEGVVISTPSPSGLARTVTWGDLNLTGRLVYTRLSSNDDISALRVETLDLTTGEIHQIFTVPEDGWIYYSAASPDSKQLIISYVPPSATNPSRTQALYRLSMDGSTPLELVVTPPSESDHYTQVEWSPDGKYLYFVHNNYNTQPADQIYPNYKIFRMAYPDGEPAQIVAQAFWPRLSPDSSKLVYVSIDPVSGANELFVANADGSNAQVIDTGGSLEPGIIDAPFFTPDGQSIIFSAPSPAQSYQPGWFDWLMGAQVAKAHSVPSDWWIVPTAGGEARRLTQLHSTNLYARMSPDNRHMVSFSIEGLFVIELDGSNLTSIFPDSGGATVDWLR